MNILDLILNLLGAFKSPKKDEPIAEPPVIKPEPEVKAPAITLDDWITSSGKYPDRAKSEELTYDVKSAAMLLVDKINELDRRIGLGKVSVSSGFRPTKVNAGIPNAAKASGHTRGMAIDFSDKDGYLKEKVAKHPEILRELGLFMEHPDATATWLHLDMIRRTDRPDRIFRP